MVSVFSLWGVFLCVCWGGLFLVFFLAAVDGLFFHEFVQLFSELKYTASIYSILYLGVSQPSLACAKKYLLLFDLNLVLVIVFDAFYFLYWSRWRTSCPIVTVVQVQYCPFSSDRILTFINVPHTDIVLCL